MGSSQTRAEILQAARVHFLSDGYEHATMRAIARRAGVDVALLSYYFGSKRGLFGASMQLAANPADLLTRALKGPMEGAPERLVRTVVEAWDDPELGASLRAFAEAAMSEPEVSRLFREMAERELLTQLAERLTGPDAVRRAATAASQVVGMIFLRYVLRLEPLASMPADELVARLAPPLRLALVGSQPPVVRRGVGR